MGSLGIDSVRPLFGFIGTTMNRLGNNYQQMNCFD
jgi:hypothetical protein